MQFPILQLNLITLIKRMDSVHRDLFSANTKYFNSTKAYRQSFTFTSSFSLLFSKQYRTFRLFSKHKAGASRLAGLAGLGLLSLFCFHEII